MIKYNLTQKDPLGSVLTGVSNALTLQNAITRNKAQKQAIKDQEENRNYLNNVVKPREDQQWKWQEEDRNTLKRDRELQAQARNAVSVLAHTPSPEARAELFNDWKTNNPDILPYIDEGYSKVQKQQAEAVEMAIKEGRRHAAQVMNMTLDQVPNYVKNISEKFPDLAKQLPLNVRNEEDLNNLKKSVALMQLSDEKRAEYLLEGITGKSGESKKGALTDYQKANLIASLRAEWMEDPASKGQEGKWKLFGANIPEVPPQEFVDWAVKNRPDEYNMIWGDGVQGNVRNPQQNSRNNGNVAKTNDPPEIVSLIDELSGGNLSRQDVPNAPDGSVLQPGIIQDYPEQQEVVVNPERFAQPQQQPQQQQAHQPTAQGDGVKAQVAKVATKAAEIGDVALQKVVAKAGELAEKGASSAEVAEVQRDFKNVTSKISDAGGSLSNELKTVWKGIMEDWHRLMNDIKNDTVMRNEKPKNALAGR